MKILDGKRAANVMKDDVKDAIKSRKYDINLAVIQVGNNAASSVYVRNKQKACDYVGITSTTYYLGDDATQEELKELIEELNEDETVNGILVQLPLPDGLNEKEILNCIDPKKDVDGFTYANVANLARSNQECGHITPCTPLGILWLLYYYNIDISGKHCVVVGRSDIVGRPMAECLLNNNATVTVCHSYTKNLEEICKTADILICAIGKPKFFNEEYIKDGAIVIDVGINRDENGKLCGDVDFNSVKTMDVMVTSVPGGVGPLTVASLMNNCVAAYAIQHKE